MMRRAVLLLALIVATGGIVVSVLGPVIDSSESAWPLFWLPWAPVGYLILTRRPGNAVGVAALLVGLCWGVSLGFLTLAEALGPTPGSAWVEMIAGVLSAFPFLAVAWLLLVFPTGTLAGRAERVVARCLVVGGVLFTLGVSLDPAPMQITGLPSPFGVDSVSALISLIGAGGSLSVVLLLLPLASALLLVIRWRRSTGVERLQFRWLVIGSAVFLIIFSIGQVVPDDSSFGLLVLLSVAAIPATIGIAVTRYRLYDIDRIVSRTVSYALVIGFLGLTFFALVTLLSSRLGADNQLVVAGATLAVAALFNPLRKRIQGWVDRRFNRSRYDTQRVMDDFASSLRDRTDPESVVDDWVGVVSATMQPSTVGVWVRSDDVTTP